MANNFKIQGTLTSQLESVTDIHDPQIHLSVKYETLGENNVAVSFSVNNQNGQQSHDEVHR